MIGFLVFSTSYMEKIALCLAGAKWYVGANFSYMIDQRMRNPNGLHPTTVGCHVDGGDGFKQTRPKGCLVLYAENGKGKGKDEGGAVESGNHKSCSSILISLFVVCFLP
ncbi:hypothetical protein C1H46_043641 [Malus baccata]|uniref:Uncharacterized protein n=1 Tax=Malus baccata TaxID=106549 RepID=A0A540K9D1_MALBA|nr:hypothetical protein C1H46_043641 [Malus baccata]